jgi:CRISPR-associated protein Cas1
MPKDLHELPKLRGSISYLYFEHAVLEQENSSIVVIQESGRIPVPISAVTCILLGPGTKVTHAAIKAMAENGCMVVWCGENAGRFYASGMGETRSAANLLLQARLCMDEAAHMTVVRRMYEIRFPKVPTKGLTLQQIRGMEGVRVRQTYQVEAKRCGIKWSARKYKQTSWDDSDEINRALSTANAILYSVCQAAIISLGFSTGLGFVHTGKLLSFVYDIADLYKTETSIPAAFEAVKEKPEDLERRVRILIRKKIVQANLMKRIADDITWIFDIPLHEEQDNQMNVGNLWDDTGEITGGKNHAGDSGWL